MSTDNSNELESNQENSKPEGMSVPQKTYTNKLYRKKSAQQFQGTRQDEYQVRSFIHYKKRINISIILSNL
jgi:hypothetical protein